MDRKEWLRIVNGDCLIAIPKHIESNSVDLIYLDPPFFSGKQYEIIWGNGAELRAYGDRFKGGINHYIEWMRPRIEQCCNVLKKTGSFYLHCDKHASHYLKVMCDEIFGSKNFRNEIIWCYRGAGTPKKDFARRHDNILRYSKTKDYIFNVDDVRGEYAKATKERFKHHIGNIRQGKDFGLQTLHEKGKHPDDWWEIQPISPSSRDRIGYPTQKPEKLLEKIILASSNKGDLILDPFVGGGTTVAVANRLNRYYIGIDVSTIACIVSYKRLKGDFDRIRKNKNGHGRI